MDSLILDSLRHPLDKTEVEKLRKLKLLNFIWKYVSRYLLKDDIMECFLKAEGFRVQENAYSNYYQMLKTVCQKIGMPMPELYLASIRAKADSFVSENKQYIVLSPLNYKNDMQFEVELVRQCFSLMLVPREYRFMSKTLLEIMSKSKLSPISKIVKIFNLLFQRVMAAVELSVDRAALLYYGSEKQFLTYIFALKKLSIDKITDDGYDEVIENLKNNKNEVEKFSKNPLCRKLLENSGLYSRGNPPTSLRLVEAIDWINSEDFKKFQLCMFSPDDANEWPLPVSHKDVVKMDCSSLKETLSNAHFTNIICEKSSENTKNSSSQDVIEISINGNTDFKKYQWFGKNIPIVISHS